MMRILLLKTMTRDFVELVALVLLISQQGSRADANVANKQLLERNSLRPNEAQRTDLSSAEQQQPQQVQYDNNAVVAQPNQDNLKRFLLKDLDLDGYMLKQSPKEQWRLFQLKELLETLSSSIPTPPPQQQSPPPPPPQLAIYRSGRQDKSFYRLTQSPNNGDNASIRRQVWGIDWGGFRPAASSALVSLRTRSQNVAPKGDRAQHHHMIGTEEVAYTPMHSRSTSDYEWKRVENLNKWNNLRGMWGKRASLSAESDSSQLPDSIMDDPATTMNYQALIEQDNQQVM